MESDRAFSGTLLLKTLIAAATSDALEGKTHKGSATVYTAPGQCQHAARDAEDEVRMSRAAVTKHKHAQIHADTHTSMFPH